MIARLVLALAAAALSTAASAEDLVVCSKISLPGRNHTLNPTAPPDKRRQEIGTFCEKVSLPDPPAWANPMAPITDFKHDPRAFT